MLCTDWDRLYTELVITLHSLSSRIETKSALNSNNNPSVSIILQRTDIDFTGAVWYYSWLPTVLYLFGNAYWIGVGCTVHEWWVIGSRHVYVYVHRVEGCNFVFYLMSAMNYDDLCKFLPAMIKCIQNAASWLIVMHVWLCSIAFYLLLQQLIVHCYTLTLLFVTNYRWMVKIFRLLRLKERMICTLYLLVSDLSWGELPLRFVMLSCCTLGYVFQTHDVSSRVTDIHTLE